MLRPSYFFIQSRKEKEKASQIYSKEPNCLPELIINIRSNNIKIFDWHSHPSEHAYIWRFNACIVLSLEKYGTSEQRRENEDNQGIPFSSSVFEVDINGSMDVCPVRAMGGRDVLWDCRVLGEKHTIFILRSVAIDIYCIQTRLNIPKCEGRYIQIA